MSREDHKRSGIDRMQPVLVDREGEIWSVTSRFFWAPPPQRDGNILDYAVSRLGFIHIWPVDGLSIVVALRPDRVHPKTLAAAFYAIADLRPVRVFIAATNPTRQGWELFKGVERALNRIEQLVTAARNSAIGTQLLRIGVIFRAGDHANHRILQERRIAAIPRGGAAVASTPARAGIVATPRHASHAGKRLCRSFLDSPCRRFLPKLRDTMGLAGARTP